MTVAKSVYETPLTHAIAGAVGGCGALVLTYPLQSISMRLQMAQKERSVKRAVSKDSLSTVGHSDSESNEEATTAQESELMASLRIVKESLGEDGIGRLYSGLGSALYGQALIQAAYYYFYSSLSARAAARRPAGTQGGFLENVVVSSLAGAAGATLTNPLWVVNARKVRTGSKDSTPAILTQIVREEGVTGLMRGLRAALVLVSNPTVAYTVFERLKAALLRGKPAGSALTAREVFAVSAFAKLIATLCTYPYLLAKTTLQAQQRGEEKQGSGVGSIIRSVYKEGGIPALYKGVNSKMWQSILTAALLFVLQEKCVKLVVRIRTAIRC
eukprot:Hpha_TRINITY_DN16874_c2_g4::TRINITY_DN16874_c2_g4_i1::g.150765::m.150765/K13354/SLC25A17, PMP34; solute carrier family 25 (peroxisomal adenine nucleotide transporter), member 17